jgi:hypothetical protein
MIVAGLRSPGALTALALGVALAAGCSAGPIDAVDLDPKSVWNGLLAHWSFDDGPGATILTDDSGHNRHGTILAGVTSTSMGQFGGALHFDGSTTDSEVDVPNFPQPTASWSVAGWVKAPNGDTGDTYATIISTEVLNTGGWQLNLALSPTISSSLYQFAFWIGQRETNPYTYNQCQCFVADQWVHVASVLDTETQTLSLYRNGVLTGTTLAPQTITSGNDTLYFGRWPNDNDRRLFGDLDDFVVYGRALAPAEVLQLTRAAVPRAPPATP